MDLSSDEEEFADYVNEDDILVNYVFANVSEELLREISCDCSITDKCADDTDNVYLCAAVGE